VNLRGKVAVITGASTGIGQAIACAIGVKGCKVVLVGRNLAGLQNTERLVKQAGGSAQVFQTNLISQTDISALAADVRRTLGAVSVLANVAGVWHNDKRAYDNLYLHEISVEEIDEVFDVNIRAAVLLTRIFLPDMIERKQGKILNISGTFANGATRWLHYYVSKKAVESFTVGLAEEVRPHRVQVNCISPSDVATPASVNFYKSKFPTALRPDDVAELALFLLSGEAADNITGQVIEIKSKDA
jgi:2-hydroxycyclohexanecarboxyl-CoA dehydrogenase